MIYIPIYTRQLHVRRNKAVMVLLINGAIKTVEVDTTLLAILPMVYIKSVFAMMTP